MLLGCDLKGLTMSVINKELYDALLLAKVPEEKAAAAARPLTKSIEGDISQLKKDVYDIKVDMAGIRSELVIIRWSLGVIFAAVIIP